MYTGKALFLYASQTVLVCLPLVCGALITADVYVWKRENFRHIVEYAFKEIDGLILSDVKDIFGYTAVNAYRVLLCGVAT